jgi:hypothetical protein
MGANVYPLNLNRKMSERKQLYFCGNGRSAERAATWRPNARDIAA